MCCTPIIPGTWEAEQEDCNSSPAWSCFKKERKEIKTKKIPGCGWVQPPLPHIMHQDWRCRPVVECWPSICDALGSNPVCQNKISHLQPLVVRWCESVVPLLGRLRKDAYSSPGFHASLGNTEFLKPNQTESNQIKHWKPHWLASFRIISIQMIPTPEFFLELHYPFFICFLDGFN